MLIQLNIRNFGIITDSTIEFKNGLTVISGETGAGKSMVLSAISQLSGQRTSTSYIRHGEDKATVEGIFDLPNNKELLNILTDLDIDIDDESIIIRRDIYSTGKSVCRINGIIVNLSTLKQVSQFLIDIHEQHDNQTLLIEKNHIKLLDNYGQNELLILLEQYKQKYKEHQEVSAKIENLQKYESEILQKIDFLKYQYEEISGLNLVVDEDIALKEESDYLANYEKINILINEISSTVKGDDGLLNGIHYVKSNLEKLTEYSSNFEEKLDEITNAYYILEDLQYELSKFSNSVEYDEERLNEIEHRLSKIAVLEKKYGRSNNELIQFTNEIEQELLELDNYEENYSLYNDKEKQLRKELENIANKLTVERKKVAESLETKIQEELKFLCMEKSIIKIDFKEKEFTANGKDDVRILISANLGEPLKSLSKVASGGELSRIMLALKIIFSRSIDAISIIFDEIDTGVSGRVSQRMAEKIYQLSIKSQVFCISHLPQTTALADNNLLIKKEISDGRTVSSILELSKEEKILEIARMTSGTKTTKLSEEYAIELLELAGNIQQEIISR